MLDAEKRSAHLALTCFLNSLFREWSGFTYDGKRFHIAIDELTTVSIGAAYFSPLGRHEYTGELFANSQPIDFKQAVEKVCERIAKETDSPLLAVETFTKRVLSSRRNVQLALEAFTPRSDLHFRDAEQSLVVGHNFHPTPKSRDEFTDEDLRRYSPEFRGSFALVWLMVSEKLLYRHAARSFGKTQWTCDLAEADGLDPERIASLRAEGFVPMPMHPWQWRILLKNPYIQKLIAAKKLFSLESTHTLWTSTSSLRSLYREDAPFMLKFSMSVKLTNSVRHLLVHEVERGQQLHDVLATQKGREFLKTHPHFRVITEPAFMAIQGETGEPLCESIVVCRENPFRGDAANGKVMLATLTQDSLSGRPSLLRELLAQIEDSRSLRERSIKWFRDYLDSVVKPLISAQAEYGVILGAHQQNLVIGIEGGYPASAYFRDCQGTGYSELGFHNFARDVELIHRKNGNVVTETMANSLFIYYLILNSTFNVISALSGREGEVTEGVLLNLLRSHLEEKRNDLLRRGNSRVREFDLSCLNVLLDDDTLMHKGNFLCAFANLNENTTADPLAIYRPVMNSIRTPQAGHPYA